MLKVLLYSHYFYPSVGGIETVSLSLAEGFIKNGLDCKVVTKSVAIDDGKFDYEVIRNPERKQQIALVKWADIILFNGASLALQPWIILYGKRFVWVHQGYQVSCIDGLGWVEGNKAPIAPFQSFIYHTRIRGVFFGVKEGFKLLLKRITAKYIVTKNVAITDWVKNIQPLPRQMRIYNPFPIDKFKNSGADKPEFDFVYLGRIVSEKGVSTLLKAFARVVSHIDYSPTLLIIGDGNWRVKMEALAEDIKITDHVTFVGKKTGDELINSVAKGRIAVIPSEWFEPMGGVVLELMAAGKNLIVSQNGGLSECLGDVGLTFPNGDDDALEKCMLKLLADRDLCQVQLKKGVERIKEFDPSIFVAEYIGLLQSIVSQSKT